MVKKLLVKYKFLILFLFSSAIIGLSFIFQSQLAQLGKWGLLGIFIINIVGSATLFIPAPAIATVVAGGLVYNPLLVAVIAAFGSSIGDMIGFGLGRSGKEFLIKKGSLKYDITQHLFKDFGPLVIILFALIPNPIFDAVGIIAGIFAYPPKRFFVYTLIGRFLRNLLLAFIGSSF